MSQPDEAPSIQQFFSWANRERKYSRISPDSDERIPFNSIPPIEAYFKEKNHERLNAILITLFEDPPPGIAEVIVKDYVAVFSILVYIGKGRHIQNFIEYNLNNQHLPFDPSHPPLDFPNSSDEGFFEKFCQQQWRFCCTIFSRDGLYNRHFRAKQILPIADKQELGKGASAVLYKIRIHDEYNHLHPPDIKSELTPEHANTFVLKTYISKDAEKVYTNEVNAFRKLKEYKNPKDATYVIGYYGSFVHGETRHILLEYADKGDLERYFTNIVPPDNGEDILSFWEGMFNIVRALMDIHTTRRQTASFFQGLHQDVKPQNILVVSKEDALPYKWQFKLGDFGLSQFKKLTSLQDGTTLDAQGTRTYGAPECYRDELLAAAQLEVTPKADIWSLGCIYSEAARWVATGARGLDAYLGDRLDETQRIPNFGDGSCFHDGEQILQTVRGSHKATIDNLHKDDTITRRVLEIVDKMLSSDPKNRPEAQQLWKKTRRILSDAQNDLSSLTNKQTAGPSMAFLDAHPPPPPPVLPSSVRAPSLYGTSQNTFDNQYTKTTNPSRDRNIRFNKNVPIAENLLLQSNSKPTEIISRHKLNSNLTNPTPATQLGFPTVQPSFLEGVLGDLETDMSSRKENFQHSNREVGDLSEELREGMNELHEGISPTDSTSSSSFNPPGTNYILSCPKEHKITYSDLKSLIVEHDSRQTGIKELGNNDPWFKVDIRCPQCDSKSRVKVAQRIVPLHISLLRRSTLPEKMPREGDMLRTGSFDSPISRPINLKKNSANNLPKKKLQPKTRPSYCFSADARSLFLWAKDAEKISIYDVSSGTPESFDAIDVHLAAGGETLYAIVSETGNHGNLHIHRVIGGTLVASIRLEFLVASIALSRNDEFVALGTVGKAVVYNTRQLSQSWTHVLPPTEDRESPCERVWFSADSDKVLAARRNKKGNVYIYVSNCKNPTTTCNIPHINNPQGHYQDYGVSSILYDNKFGYACVSAYGSKMPPCLFSLEGNPQRHNLDSGDYRQLGTEIQSATSHPNSKRPEFVLVNSENNIFSVQKLSSGQWQVEKLCKLSLNETFRQDEMTIIAMPTQNTINAFRIQGRERILTTLTISNDESTRRVSKFPRDIAAELTI